MSEVQTITYNLGSIPEWITAFSTFFALIGILQAYREYNERTRPYIDIEIKTDINREDDTWSLSALILNKGQYPVYSKIAKSLLIIGDEKYPTTVDQELVLFPGEAKITIPVGHINARGRKKIREAKYTKNVVELQLEASSRKLNKKKYKYKTVLRIQILVEEENPGFILLEKSFV